MATVTLPLAELHCHLEGSIAPPLARRLAARHSINIDGLIGADGRYIWKDFQGFLCAYDAVAALVREPQDYHDVVRDYYARAAASNVAKQLKMPTLILHAANDPFIRILPETRKKIAANPNIQFVESADGGHCSFIAEANGYDGFWAERQIVNFLKRF